MGKQKNQAPLIPPKELSFGRILKAARDFGRMEAAGGILLIVASLAAIVIANSPLFNLYDYVLNKIHFRVGFFNGFWELQIEKSLLHWVNDGLMALFFFLIGLELKEEMSEGSLSSFSQILSPALAAVGGILVPVALFAVFNWGMALNMKGWAIPAGTDIAFALCILSFVSKRVPLSLKIFLTALAIFDDIAAIFFIALFYSTSISKAALILSLPPLAGLIALNRKGVSAKTPYILLALTLWTFVLESGVHATLAGFLSSLFIPLKKRGGSEICPNSDLQKDLHPWVAFLVLPLFGFANAGVPFDGMNWQSFLDPVVIGIALGLFLGKQLGVFLFTALPIRWGFTKKPEGADWAHIYGVAVLCGIGFTMSLFIGTLAFTDVEMQANVRLGVLSGSLLSALLGYFVIRRFCPIRSSN